MEHDDEKYEDNTIDSFSYSIRSSLYRTMLAGLGGGFSSAGFKYREEGFRQATNVEVMQLFFLVLIFVVQIIALNGLIAILGESYQRVNNEKHSRVNRELARMMVEYMDTWSFLPEPLASVYRQVVGRIRKACFPPKKKKSVNVNSKLC